MKCPICEQGTLKKGAIDEYMFGVYLGKFPAEICTHCKESFTDSATTKLIEEAAKKKGIWGLSTITTITKTGNSLAVRIPKKIIAYLKLKQGEKVHVHPEKDKLVIEPQP